MVKKIFLFFIFFLSVFLLPKQSALAANCTFNISQDLLANNASLNLDVYITSNKTLSPGASYKATLFGTATTYVIASPRNQGVDAAQHPSTITPTLDDNGDTGFVFTVPRGLLEGTFKIYVKSLSASDTLTDPNDPNMQCVSNDFTVRASNGGSQCVVHVSSGTNKTSDPVSFYVSDFIPQNDRRRVVVLKNGAIMPDHSLLSENCYDRKILSDPTKPINLGPLPQGNYIIRIGDGCGLFDSYSKACDSGTIPITAEGGGTVKQSATCYYCPPGCVFTGSNTAPACQSSTGTVCAAKAPTDCNQDPTNKFCTGHCDPDTQVCDTNHVYGCMGGGSGGTGGGTIGGSDWSKNPPPDVCKPNAGYNGNTCETAIGNIQTSAAGFVNSIMSLILSLVGGIAVILIIISGYRLMVSQGNPENLKSAKDQLTAAIIGLLFVIFALVFLSVIGVNILGLPGFKQ